MWTGASCYRPAMLVSASARALFVHVQKTGGLTVESTLLTLLPDAQLVRGLPDGRHARLGAALRAHPEYADFWIFGFVRNPWARMYSWHSMIQRRRGVAESGNSVVAEQIQNNKFWSKVAAEFPDFESFVMRGPDEFRRLRTPQVRYLESGQRKADFIGRTESLTGDLQGVLEHLGLPPLEETPHKNAGPSGDYRAAYTDEMQARVGELFAADVAAFDYRF